MNSSEYPDRPGVRVLYHAARGTAVVAGAFCLIICMLLVLGLIQTRRADPLESPALERLISGLADQPDNDDLKEQIRELDLLARRAYFSSVSFMR
ncbi:hypothetical protein ACFL01_00905, partial [Planctomycetota bacterium]